MKFLFLFLLCILVLPTLPSLAQDDEKIILFHSKDCPYCYEVIEIIDEYKLNETLNIEMVEANQENFSEIFEESLEKCNLDPKRGGYPTLFYKDSECSVGSINVINTLFELGNVEVEDESQESKDIETEELENNPNKNTNEEIFEWEDEEIKPRSIIQILMILLGPALLISLGYYMIKKLNL